MDIIDFVISHPILSLVIVLIICLYFHGDNEKPRPPSFPRATGASITHSGYATNKAALGATDRHDRMTGSIEIRETSGLWIADRP